MAVIELPASLQPRASIIILALRQAPYLTDCLRSLVRNGETAAPYEVIIVLNEPDPALSERVSRQVRSARVVVSPVNLGFGGGVNAGAELARGEFLVLLNDDAEVEPRWLTALIEAADAHPEAGAIGSRVLAWDGTIQEAGGALARDGSMIPLGHGRPGDTADLGDLRPVDFASGCSLLIRRSTWEAVGGFDLRYFPAYYEDADLCYAIRAHGQAVLCEGRSAVRHRHSASVSPLFKDFLLRRNAARFRERWADQLALRPSPSLNGAAGVAGGSGEPDPDPLSARQPLGHAPPTTPPLRAQDLDPRSLHALLCERAVITDFVAQLPSDEFARWHLRYSQLEIWARELERAIQARDAATSAVLLRIVARRLLRRTRSFLSRRFGPSSGRSGRTAAR